MNCKNCGHIVDSKFCGNCGQSSAVGRIDFANFVHEVSLSLFQVDRGFFYTLKELTIRPGDSLKEFLDGKRKSHFKPIAYLLTLSAIYFFTTQLTSQNTLIDDLVEGWMRGASEQNPNVVVPRIASWFLWNYAYTTLLLLPIFSLASYLSFSRFHKTYLEHIVVNSYITGQQAIIYTLFTVSRTVIDSQLLEMFPVIFSVSYTYWVYWRFFSEGTRSINILRSTMTYLLYMLLSTGLLVFLMINEF
jgi:hypothetical protein